MRIVFMGSPDFAVPALERIIADGHTVTLVITQPERPAGRGRELRSPAVKRTATRHGLPVAQPERVGHPDVLSALRAARPEACVVVAFGQYLPRDVRILPPLGCVNLHASLLPRFRGAAPIHRAIMAGETRTGVTIMRVEGEMDAGPILLQRECPILPEDDAGSLHDRLADLGAAALAEALRILAAGDGRWVPQDARRASLAPKIGDADCRVEICGDPVALVNHIRGLSPSPGAYLVLSSGERLKVLKAEPRTGSGPSGVILAIEGASVVIGTGPGAVALVDVQPAGKRRMTAAEYARGRRLCVGARYA